MKQSEYFMKAITELKSIQAKNHKEISSKVDNVKEDVNEIKIQVAEVRKDINYNRTDVENMKGTVHNHDIQVNRLKTDVELLKEKTNINKSIFEKIVDKLKSNQITCILIIICLLIFGFFAIMTIISPSTTINIIKYVTGN